MGAVQMEIFPRVNKMEFQKVKQLLQNLPGLKKIVVELQGREKLTDEEMVVLKQLAQIIANIELGINSIIDLEVRAIMKYRFINNNPRKAAVKKWNYFTDRSFDRKVEEGIISVSGTLKLLGHLQ